MTHSFVFLIFRSITCRSSLYISHSPTMWVLLYCVATSAHLCIIFLLPSTTGIPLSTFWQVQVPHAKSHFQRFRPLGRANTFSFLFLLLTPRKSLSVPPPSPCFLALASPYFYPTVSLLGFLLYPPIFSRLRYPTLFKLALLLLSPIQPYQLWMAPSVLAWSLLHIAISTFSRLYSF